MTPKASRYSWLIKHGREGMASAHRLSLLSTMNQHYPFQKTIPSSVYLGTNPPNPAHTSKHSHFKGATSLGEDVRIWPLFVNSPGTLLGCDTISIINDILKAELIWHLLCQHCPALDGSVMLSSKL